MVKTFTWQDMIALNPMLTEAQAKFNVGLAYTYTEFGKPLFAGGVRDHNIGEAWFQMSSEAMERAKRSIGFRRKVVEVMKDHYQKITELNRFARIFSVCEIDAHFIELAGFKRVDGYIWEPTQ